MKTIREQLAQLGLEQYAEAFERWSGQREAIGAEILSKFTDEDLWVLGVVSLDHRRALLEAFRRPPAVAVFPLSTVLFIASVVVSFVLFWSAVVCVVPNLEFGSLSRSFESATIRAPTCRDYNMKHVAEYIVDIKKERFGMGEAHWNWGALPEPSSSLMSCVQRNLTYKRCIELGRPMINGDNEWGGCPEAVKEICCD